MYLKNQAKVITFALTSVSSLHEMLMRLEK